MNLICCIDAQTVATDLGEIPEACTATDDEPSRLRIEYLAHQYFAICTVQRSVACWLRTKRCLEAMYMEEYKNKIKKPSGRPKKVRDARVYTIM